MPTNPNDFPHFAPLLYPATPDTFRAPPTPTPNAHGLGDAATKYAALPEALAPVREAIRAAHWQGASWALERAQVADGPLYLHRDQSPVTVERRHDPLFPAPMYERAPPEPLVLHTQHGSYRVTRNPAEARIPLVRFDAAPTVQELQAEVSRLWADLQVARETVAACEVVLGVIGLEPTEFETTTGWAQASVEAIRAERAKLGNMTTERDALLSAIRRLDESQVECLRLVKELQGR